jgi:cytochrome b561
MQAALVHVFMLIFAGALARLGWFMSHNPERASRLFTFDTGSPFGKRLALTWSRAVGWFFTVGGCIGITLYLVLIPIDLLHSR